jgi:hypothetical protein
MRSAVVVRPLGLQGRSFDRIILPRDADVTQPVKVLNNLIEPCIRIWRFVQTSDQRRNEFPRQPYDALIFGLNTRPGLQDEPRNIDSQAERQDEREKQVDPGA